MPVIRRGFGAERLRPGGMPFTCVVQAGAHLRLQPPINPCFQGWSATRAPRGTVDAELTEHTLRFINGKALKAKDGTKYVLEAKYEQRSGGTVITADLHMQNNSISRDVLTFYVEPDNSIVFIVDLSSVSFSGRERPFDWTRKGLGHQIYRLIDQAVPAGRKLDATISERLTRNQLWRNYTWDESDKTIRTKTAAKLRVVDNMTGPRQKTLDSVIAETFIGYLLGECGGFSQLEISYKGFTGRRALEELLKGPGNERLQMVESFSLTAIKQFPPAATP